jgi:peptidoglycan/xylan/chitin deacetylase (PgdA/CDA1 family)
MHAVFALVACCPVALAVTPTAASVPNPEPAFYTYQAPGGAATFGQRDIALTFDDGPGPYTPQVLSVLEHYHVPATFFEIGENVVQYPQYTRLVASAGYPVEDHTWTHPDLSTIPVSQFPYQIDQTQNEIRALTGDTPSCVRPPYDDWDTTVLDQIAVRGLTTMSYSIDPRDWTLPGVQAIVDSVVGAAFPGAVVDMHDGGGDRSETVEALPQIITGLEADGYKFVSICGAMAPSTSPQVSEVFSFGSAASPGRSVISDKPLAAMTVTSDGLGYWLTAQDGGVFSFDASTFHGSMAGRHLNEPIVGMAATSDGLGYWLVASDGGVFSFGDARFHGSMGGRHLNALIVGMAATSDGLGYWLVASDGGVFSFGDARFHGSMVGRHLNAPIVGIAADSAAGGHMGASAGYWLVGADGGVFSFDADFNGSVGGEGSGDRFFAISSSGDGYLVAGEHASVTG